MIIFLQRSYLESRLILYRKFNARFYDMIVAKLKAKNYNRGHLFRPCWVSRKHGVASNEVIGLVTDHPLACEQTHLYQEPAKRGKAWVKPRPILLASSRSRLPVLTSEPARRLIIHQMQKVMTSSHT